jgi:outer membrane protein OmpA-like peptidoglycan-associated protein
MRPQCHHITLGEPGSAPRQDRRIYLVDTVDALRLCEDGDFERVEIWRASREIRHAGHELAPEVERFAARGDGMRLRVSQLAADEVADQLICALEHGALVAVRVPRAASATDEPVVAQRRLLRELKALVRGRLAAGGRQYKLVAGADLASLPDRNRYEVVSSQEAVRVLAELAQPPAPAKVAALLGQAGELLSPDWRPPFLPKGVVLLRRVVETRVASAPAPALTPSQMRAQMAADAPLEFFARFVDERGEGIGGFAGKLAYADDPDEDLAFSAADFAQSGEHRGPRDAGLTLPEAALRDLARKLERRWQKVRGEADETWKEEEETLLEVELPTEGPLELSRDAGQKHTFVLRPAVALAHLHGMYFDTNKCFLLPSAKRSLRELVVLYRRHEGDDVLIVGHTDTAGTEADNLPLSGERADALRAYLCDDAEAWLAWYGKDVPQGKRWGAREDNLMLDALLPPREPPLRTSGRRVLAYQEWHNAKGTDASDPADRRPDGWEQLKPDGKLGPKTRRQLVVDYMNIDGTSLPKDTRVVTYGCGELYPLDKEEGAIDPAAADGQHVLYDRRVELFFFGQPFGILPEVLGVAKAASNPRAVLAEKGAKLYPEWRLRAARRYLIAGPEREICLVNEIGLPLAKRKVRVVVPEREAVEVESDDEGKIRVAVPLGSEFDLIIEGIHEGGEGDSLVTASGTHFATGADGPEAAS